MSGAGRLTAASVKKDVGRLHPIVWLYLITIVVPVGFNAGSVALTGLRILLLVMVVPLSVRLFTGGSGKLYPVDFLFFLHIA